MTVNNQTANTSKECLSDRLQSVNLKDFYVFQFDKIFGKIILGCS